jgi:hypothetical protein
MMASTWHLDTGALRRKKSLLVGDGLLRRTLGYVHQETMGIFLGRYGAIYPEINPYRFIRQLEINDKTEFRKLRC